MTEVTWKELVAGAMKRRGFSIRSLAKQCQVSPTTVRNFKEGKNLRINTFIAIAHYLDLAMKIDFPKRVHNHAIDCPGGPGKRSGPWTNGFSRVMP